MIVKIYTDGACNPNPGPGGWGAVLCYGEKQKTLSGFETNTTNNRMELTAVIASLQALTTLCKVELYTDSNYVKQGITIWIKNWQKNNWKAANGKPVKNQDLWQALFKESLRHKICWHWIKGHSGHPKNELADCLARDAITTHAK